MERIEGCFPGGGGGRVELADPSSACLMNVGLTFVERGGFRRGGLGEGTFSRNIGTIYHRPIQAFVHDRILLYV